MSAINDKCERIGKIVARRVFRERGNHSEAHLSEAELAIIASLAAQLAWNAGELAFPELPDDSDGERGIWRDEQRQ